MSFQYKLSCCVPRNENKLQNRNMATICTTCMPSTLVFVFLRGEENSVAHHYQSSALTHAVHQITILYVQNTMFNFLTAHQYYSLAYCWNRYESPICLGCQINCLLIMNFMKPCLFLRLKIGNNVMSKSSFFE